MNQSRFIRRLFLYLLVFVSGASALIYEIIWHRYLSLLLGVQARATAIVLAVFLGGMALGYFTFGKWSRTTKRNLLGAYALVEILIALWGASFPWLYAIASGISNLFYQKLGISSFVTDVVLSIGLVGVPTFLMGGTLPLLTQGMGERGDEASRSHARIYGWNTVGGCLGCLLAGYLLIPSLGLMRTSLFAATLNACVGIAAWVFFRRPVHAKEQIGSPPPLQQEPRSPLSQKQRFAVMCVGLLSGFILITLQSIFIRLAELAVGASNYTFTLTVSVYVLSLGLGSLVANRFSSYSYRHLVLNLVILSFLFLGIYVSGDYWSYTAHVLRVVLNDVGPSFVLFQFLLAFVFISLLGLPLAIAGFTLPLCFHLIRNDHRNLGHDVGLLYGINMVGCVLGALIGGHVALHWWDLDQIFKGVVFLWMLAAAFVAYAFSEESFRSLRSPYFISVGSSVIVATFLVLFLPRYDKTRFLQPFRYRKPTVASFQGAAAFGKFLLGPSTLLAWNDGPNSSLAIGATRNTQGQETNRTIYVDGKSDGDTRGDRFTMQISAQLPALLATSIKRSCVIGFGTGITAGTLAGYTESERVDVLEIAGSLVEFAAEFDPYNYSASKNPKVRLHAVDALRYFAENQSNYDLIISEPSNPWIAGIENLYSAEFYKNASKNLSPGGLYVQWINTYAFNEQLFKVILRTMHLSFDYVTVFQLQRGDVLLIGSSYRLGLPDIERGKDRLEKDSQAQKMLAHIGIDRVEALLALEIFTPEMTQSISGSGPVQTLDRPLLSVPAARAFFLGDRVQINSMRRNLSRQTNIYFSMLQKTLLWEYTRGSGLDAPSTTALLDTFCKKPLSRNKALCRQVVDLSNIRNKKRVPPFQKDDLSKIHLAFENYKTNASPILHVRPDAFLDRLNSCLVEAPKPSELFGECLLERVIVLEALRPGGPELRATIEAYGDWFSRLSPKATKYEKFRQAQRILGGVG